MKGDDEFIKMGAAHAAAGIPRYHFQDPHLQALYDKGYKLEAALIETIRKRCASCGEVYQAMGGTRYCSRCRGS